MFKTGHDVFVSWTPYHSVVLLNCLQPNDPELVDEINEGLWGSQGGWFFGVVDLSYWWWKKFSPPGMYKTLQIFSILPHTTYQLVQDFFHQRYGQLLYGLKVLQTMDRILQLSQLKLFIPFLFNQQNLLYFLDFYSEYPSWNWHDPLENPLFESMYFLLKMGIFQQTSC